MTNVRRPIHLQLRPAAASGGLAAAANGLQRSQQQLQQQQQKSALSPTGDSLPSQILPHLFVGNQEQTNRETVNRLNISYILSLGLLPMISSSASPTSPTTTTTNNNGSANSGAQSQTNTQILLPNQNSSIDFKIRIRASGSGGTPTNSNFVINSSNSSPQQQQQQTNTYNIDSTTNNIITPQTVQSNGNTQNIRPSSPLLDGCGGNHNHLQKSTTTPTCNQSTASPTATTANQRTGGGGNSIPEQAPNYRDNENKGVKASRSIHCKCINIADNNDQFLVKFFDEAHEFIEEARRKKCNILVHCLAGISRSPTFAIAYLMRLQSLRLTDAYNLVKQCRPQIDPNLSFMGQLMVYDKSLKDRRLLHASNQTSLSVCHD